MVCKKCGANMPDTYKICMRCGASLIGDNKEEVDTDTDNNDEKIKYAKKSHNLLRLTILILFSIIGIISIYLCVKNAKFNFQKLQNILITILFILLILIIGKSLYNNRDKSFKNNFLSILIVFLIISIITELLLGSLLVFISVRHWISLIIISLVSSLIYFVIKKLIWFIMNIMDSINIFQFYIVYLGLISPFLYLMSRK